MSRNTSIHNESEVIAMQISNETMTSMNTGGKAKTEDKYTLPMPVKVRPFFHQNQAFDFVCGLFGLIPWDGVKSRGVMLACEMGTGKSLIAIAVIGILYQLGLIESVVIVGPLSTLSVWEEQLSDFADYPYRLTILSGSTEKKKKTLRELPKDGLNIVVINYESTWRMEVELLEFSPNLVIADEGHKIKENRSKQSKALHSLGDRASYRLLLTGTPVTNKEIDIYSQYRFLNKNIFGTSFFRFRNAYFDMKGYGQHTPVFREINRDEFLRKMHSIAFRITKEECLDLPPIREQIRTIDLEPKARSLYAKVLGQSYAKLNEGEVTAANILTRLLRLSQIAGGFITDDDKVTTAVSRAKLDALSDILDSAIEEDKKIVVMARFTAELDSITEMLEKKHIGYAVIRGGVKNRGEEIRRFQEDDDCLVFLGQISAAGLGITLTAASTMVFYSMNYSMSDFSQAQARIHRASQKHSCDYIYLICRNTVDVKVLHALRHKVDLAKMLVDDYRKGLNPFA